MNSILLLIEKVAVQGGTHFQVLHPIPGMLWYDTVNIHQQNMCNP